MHPKFAVAPTDQPIRLRINRPKTHHCWQTANYIEHGFIFYLQLIIFVPLSSDVATVLHRRFPNLQFNRDESDGGRNASRLLFVAPTNYGGDRRLGIDM